MEGIFLRIVYGEKVGKGFILTTICCIMARV